MTALTSHTAKRAAVFTVDASRSLVYLLSLIIMLASMSLMAQEVNMKDLQKKLSHSQDYLL